MDMDMVTAMNAEKLLRAGLAASLLFLAGCKAGPEVTADDAAEVALDDAGFAPADVTSLTSDAAADGDGFTVSFHTPRGVFTYEISSGGLIEDRKYQKDPQSAPVESGETPEDQAQAAKQEEAQKETKSENTEKKESKKEDQKKTTRSAEEETAISLALGNAGLAESDVTDLNVSMDGDTATVTFYYGENRNTVQVDVANGQVISSLIG